MNEAIKDEFEIRKEKLEKLKKTGIYPYPDKFEKTHTASLALALKLGTKKIRIAGRILTKRTMGKITFAHLLDDSGKIQVVFKDDETGESEYKIFNDLIDGGDFIGVEGELFATKKGETSILVRKYTFLGKSLRPLPEKWHGLKDVELRYRERYLDLLSNTHIKEVFVFRSNFIRLLREFYWSQGFIELETPILANTASGALAKPFTTHHNALDIDIYLRISAGELWQKMAIIGGFEKTFELGKVFRNEGMDPSHLQEFTMIEHYVAYWNFEDNMKFTEEMFSHLLKKLFGTMKIGIKNRKGEIAEIDFTPPWPKVTFRDVIKKDCGIDIDKFSSHKELCAEIKKKKLYTEDMAHLGMGNLVDALYKTVSRDKIFKPTFIIHHPIDVSPLARKNDKNPKVVDRFQLLVNGWEIVNAYSELVDPEDQQERFKQQVDAKSHGDEETHGEDKEFITALEHGAPPISGWGMGIDRIVALLTQQDNLRDVVLFPLLRPEE